MYAGLAFKKCLRFVCIQVADAMQKMHDRKNVGKLILDPTMEPKPKIQVCRHLQMNIISYLLQ